MKLRRLVEMIRENCAGAEDWPVLFASYVQDSSGEWEETGPREPVTKVQVEIGADEVLLIRDPDLPELSVSKLENRLSDLLAQYSEFMVDSCQPPIEVEELGSVHVDFPISGVGQDVEQNCFLVLFLSSTK